MIDFRQLFSLFLQIIHQFKNCITFKKHIQLNIVLADVRPLALCRKSIEAYALSLSYCFECQIKSSFLARLRCVRVCSCVLCMFLLCSCKAYFNK